MVPTENLNLYPNCTGIFFAMGCETKDAKAKAALKAKLRRVCELKANDKLNVPQWLHDQWKNQKGNHLQMALELQKVDFDKDPRAEFSIPNVCHFQSKVLPIPPSLIASLLLAGGFRQGL